MQELSLEIIDKLQEWLSKKCPILIFFPTISLMFDYFPLFIKRFSQVATVHSQDIERHDKVKKFKQKKIKILLTTTILERGITYKNLCVAVIHSDHYQFNEASLVQIAGRVDRKIDNQYSDIIFYYHKISLAMLTCQYHIKKMNKLAKLGDNKLNAM